MNAVKAFELALKDTLQAHAQLGEATWVRCCQSQRGDWETRTAAKRFFPQVYICGQPEVQESEACTLGTRIELTVATFADDDPDCDQRATIYEAVRTVIDPLYRDSVSGEPSEVTETFTDKLAAYLPTANYGGLTLDDSPAPFETDGIQAMTVSLTVHWSI